MFLKKEIYLFTFTLSIFLLSSNLGVLSKNLESTSDLKDINMCLENYNLKIDNSRARNIIDWKNKIKNYSERHYKENTWVLNPKVIVLHYTVSKGFPWNLVNSIEFANEKPGLASHYVVGNKIWELLPTNIRSRGAYGINHVAINIEMIALNENDLFNKKEILINTAKLVSCLMKKYSIPISKVYSHEEVSKMNTNIIPEVKDLIDSRAYGKIDPGEKNMSYILNFLKESK
jgi:hypothetical protein